MTDPHVDRLFSVWDERRARGESVPVEDLCRDAPELLPALRARIEHLLRIEQMAADTASARAPDDTASYVAAPDASLPTRLGDYVVRGELGRGGMGVVLRADDPKLGRQVAIKMMLPGLAADAGARARFLREARAVAALRHEHVVPIYHVGEDAGTPYLVMPLLEGETLADRLKRGPLTPVEVIRVGREIAEGLAAAHAKGLIHRDVKPANVWLESPGDRVRLLDFGLARTVDGADGLSRPGAIVGTAAYMSPEQADGLPLDARSDLFSLGAVLYHAATGRPPFEGKTLTAILRAVADHHPLPPKELNPAIPQRLSDEIMHFLRKSADERPASATTVAAEMVRIARTRVPVVSPVNPLKFAKQPVHSVQAGRSARYSTWRRAAPVIGLTVLLSLCVFSVILSPLLVPQDIGPTADKPWVIILPELNRKTDLTGKTTSTSERVPPTSLKYRGSVDLLVHRVDADGSDLAVPLSDSRAMPLKPGDHFKIVAEVDPPAFVYILWIDETGAGWPMYPWVDLKWGTRPAVEKPQSRVEVKASDGNWLSVGGEQAGMETMVMLARPEPLSATDAEVQGWLAGLKPIPLRGERARAWFENFDLKQDDPLRSPTIDNTVRDEASPFGLQTKLKGRIGTHAPYSRAISFARLGKPEGK